MSRRSLAARALAACAASAAAAPSAPAGWLGCLRGLSGGALQPSAGAAAGAAAQAARAAHAPDAGPATPRPAPRPWELPRNPKPVVLPPEALPPLAPRQRAPASQRTGVLAVKCGMTCDWTSWGERLPLTVVWLDDCQVVQVKTPDKEGYTALQVGAGSRKAKQVTSPLAGHFRWAGVPIKRRLAEFRVSADALLPAGTPLHASHFAPGQYVDVAGTTIGHGFAGGMKRHGFSGQGASHGNSVSHRALGSTGCRQDPGRVWKGKKMPGQMGAVRRTVQSVLVHKVDAARGLLYLKGQVPGHAGGWLEVRDALRKTLPSEVPFPTYVEPAPGALAALQPAVAPPGADPFDKVQPDRGVKKAAA